MAIITKLISNIFEHIFVGRLTKHNNNNNKVYYYIV